VLSDEWAAYSNVSSLPNMSQHDTVNPNTGVHTQNVESYWNRQKTKLKRMKGVVFDSYLDEFMHVEGKMGKNIKGFI